MLLEQTRINDHAIKLVGGKEPLYELIYSLGLIKLKILQTLIEIILANNFIKPFNSLAGAIILFV